VVGGGNVAMDAARAARRLTGTGDVTIVYRRTERYMPADAEELELALADGVTLMTLLAPVSWDKEAGRLPCRKLMLGEPDASGRRSPVETEETVTLPADLLIAAIGEKADGALLTRNGVTMGLRGKPIVNSETLESGTRRIYVAGDARRGPASVAEAIADAHRIADAIAGEPTPRHLPAGRRGEAMIKKGILKQPGDPASECDRCLECATLCECCVDVCPNRANVAVTVPTRRMPQIIHIDGMCNECGNCAAFCPYDSAPYREKFTVFGTAADFEDSDAPGFVLLDAEEQTVRVRLEGGLVVNTSLRDENSPLPSGLHELMETVCTDYSYLLY
jgi:putative selenate reductase